jgi:hypothetical protein
MAHLSRLSALALAPLMLLAGCGGGGSDEAEDSTIASDAAATSALGDQIMVDPDLAGQNQANSAVSADSGSGELPPEMRTPDAIARARALALNLVGGPGKLRKTPKALAIDGTLPADSPYNTALQTAARAGDVDCSAKAGYTMEWAAKLPATFPVYPLGSVQEAAGTDDGGCKLRVVNYLSAVPLSEVIDFYYTRAADAGFKVQHVKDGDDDVLAGVKDGSSFTVYARKKKAGSTEVDLVTSGA